MSTLQVLNTVYLFDYEYDAQGNALPNERIVITLVAPAVGTGTNPVTDVQNRPIRVLTDANGYWSAPILRASDLNPANTYYNVRSSTRSRDIQLLSSDTTGSYVQASTRVISGTPTFPAAAPQTVGNLTVNGTLAVTGATTLTGTLAVTGAATLTGGVLTNSIDRITAGTLAIGAATATGVTITPPTTITGAAILSSTLAVTSLLTASAGISSGGHIVSTGATPTLGALQTGIASQSISGTDTKGYLSLTTTASPPGAGALIAAITYATAYGAVAPVSVSFDLGTASNVGAPNLVSMGPGGFSLATSTTALSGSSSYFPSYHVVG